MSRVPSDMTKIAKAIAEKAYIPPKAQREAKAAFKLAHRDVEVPGKVTAEYAATKSQDKRVLKWWDEGGEEFQSWFLDREEFRRKVELAVDLAMDALTSILSDPTQKASDTIKAINLALQIRDMTVSEEQNKQYIDGMVAKMDQEELEAFIKENKGLLS